MNDFDPPTDSLALVEHLARAVREELGEETDAYPGAHSPERADPLNRAFAAVVGAVLAVVTGDTHALTGSVSLTLRLAAERRLAAVGWGDEFVRDLIDEEPGHPDDWLIFLLLSARAQIEPVLDDDGGADLP